MSVTVVHVGKSNARIMDPRAAEHPRPSHFILHLSDTHLIAADGDLYGDVDSESRLRQILGELEESGARPEAIVVTGDLADKGEPGAYRKLRLLMEPIAARLGAQIIWAMGNHDERGAFRKELFGQIPSQRPVDLVYDVNGLRIITLDTTVPGEHYGELTSDQLDWLAEELATEAPDGTILAMHHPPVPSIKDLTVLVELRDQASLAEVVEGSDVRSIIAGHLHFSTNAMFAGVPVSVASATCYTADLNIPVNATRGQDGAQAYNLVHVYPDTIVNSVVPIGSYRTVGEYVSPEDVAERLAAAGVVIPAAAPRHRAEPVAPLLPPDLSLTGPIGTL